MDEGAESATFLADAARGHYVGGVKVADCKLKRLVVSGNPLIGWAAAKTLVKAIANDKFTHVEIAGYLNFETENLVS